MGWGRCVAVCLLAGVACASDPVELDKAVEPAGCPCNDSGGEVCPATHCGLRILVDSGSCTEKLAMVEVFIGDTLESKPWKVGAPRLACRALKVGEKAVVYARADSPWMWQSEPLECAPAQAGKAIDHVLECKTGG